MSEKVRAGEKRQKGYMYFVSGENLQIMKAKMARGGKRKKKKRKLKAIYSLLF